MSATPGCSPVLVEASRGGVVEARHRGRVLVITGLPAGGTAPREVAAGDVDSPLLPRSALKPLQAVALIEAGFVGRAASLALACASHDGEQAHLDVVRAMLTRAALTEDDLQCPPSLPLGGEALVAWVRAGGAAARVCHNCSGKHAAMLATCRAAGWSLESYCDPGHPLQRAIQARIASLTGEPVATVVVDGCGAPAFAASLRGLARGFSTLATAQGDAPAAVAGALRTYPGLITAAASPFAELSREVPGLICKDGAEGTVAAALPDGRAFAAKFDDGAGRARPPLLAAVLQYWGYDGPAVRRWARVPVLGGGERVGAITAAAALQDLLAG